MTEYAGRYSENLQDRYGNGFRNAKVAVKTLAGDQVTLYTDRVKTAYVPASGLAANEIKADTKGNLVFFADPGNYQIVVTPNGGGVLSPFSVSVGFDPLEAFVLASDPRLALVFNVSYFGAVGDGITNDATAIQAAIASASLAGGGIVFFPPGTYLIGTRIALKDRVSLKGSGARVSIIKPTVGVSTAVFLGTSGDSVTDAFYEDFGVTGDYLSSGLTLKGFQITGGRRLLFNRLRIADVAREGVGLQTGTTDCLILHCEIEASGLDGNTSGHAVNVSGGSHRNKVIANKITNGLGMGVSISDSGGGCTDCQVCNNYISNLPSVTGFEAIGVADAGQRAIVSGNQCLDSHDNGISVSSNDCTVTGNTINGAENYGIWVGGDHNAITGNVVKNAGREVSGVTYAGIVLAGSNAASKNTVSGNTVYDDQIPKTQEVGIYETTGADFNLIVANIALDEDQVNGGIAITGANTIVANNLT